MKKIFLLVAFAGIVGASSAGTFQDEKKHDCSKHTKAECQKMKNDSIKNCAKGHGKKDCCKKGATPAKPATTPAK